MPTQMTSTAWGQGFKNALICGTGFLIVCIVIVPAVSLISGRSISASVGVVLEVLWGLALLVFVGTWLHGRANAGRVLLDCGRHPAWMLFLIGGVFFLAVGLMAGLTAAAAWEGFTVGDFLRFVAFAAFFLILASGRLQVRENGIWVYTGLLPWYRIGSYRWASDSTLIVRRKGPLAFFQGALPIPPEYRPDVERLLGNFAGERPAGE